MIRAHTFIIRLGGWFGERGRRGRRNRGVAKAVGRRSSLRWGVAAVAAAGRDRWLRGTGCVDVDGRRMGSGGGNVVVVVWIDVSQHNGQLPL
jgi:hypothetical protein